MIRGLLLMDIDQRDPAASWRIDSARAMVDTLTILVRGKPDAARFARMGAMAPGCRIVGEKDGLEPVDLLFTGSVETPAIAGQPGLRHVPLLPPGGIDSLPPVDRSRPIRTIVLHGVESTGKSVLADRLARYFNTIWIPEYGRAHAEAHGPQMDETDLLLIGKAQTATITAGRCLARHILFADTDTLMTAAWAQMMIGHQPDALLAAPKADLYLLLEADVPWIGDTVRIYGDDPVRARFAAICRNVLEASGVDWVSIGGDWPTRFAKAVSIIESMRPPGAFQGFDLAQENE